MKQRLSNTEFLTDLMDNSPLVQCFIIDAIDKQARAIAEMPLADLKEAFGNNAMVSAEGWHRAAQTIAAAMKERLS